MTTLNDQPSFYEILELTPDASPQEVREAYLRTKSAYNKDSIALYTLISSEERDEMLNRIEEAYDTLSNVDRRKAYDHNHGLLDLEDDYQSPTRVPLNKKIISIDRVPPMENSANSENLLVAPSTDFGSEGNPPPPPSSNFFSAADVTNSTTVLATPPDALDMEVTLNEVKTPVPPPVIPPAPQPAVASPRRPLRGQEAILAQEIAQEVDWKGSFLRKVREARRTSIEELSGITKVGKNYIQAIEEENFAKLPAAVFLRGFISQIAKVLKVPHEQVTTAYMARYYQARPDKHSP